MPDVSFIGRDRLKLGENSPSFWPGAPDLAIEVVSPRDTYAEVEDKVFEYLGAGCRMVIVVNPKKRTATVFRSDTDIVVLNESDEIDGKDVVPGVEAADQVDFRELVACGGITITGSPDSRITCSDTLPSAHRVMPDRPRVVITTMLLGRLCARSTMLSAG